MGDPVNNNLTNSQGMRIEISAEARGEINIEEEKNKKFKSIFQIMDKDGNGKVSNDEVQEFAQKLNSLIPLNKAEVALAALGIKTDLKTFKSFVQKLNIKIQSFENAKTNSNKNEERADYGNGKVDFYDKTTGKLIRSEITSESTEENPNPSTLIYYYDEDGKIIKSQMGNFTSEYDKDGYIKKETQTNDKGDVEIECEYEPDTKATSGDSNSKPVKPTQKTRYADGKVQDVTTYTDNEYVIETMSSGYKDYYSKEHGWYKEVDKEGNTTATCTFYDGTKMQNGTPTTGTAIMHYTPVNGRESYSYTYHENGELLYGQENGLYYKISIDENGNKTKTYENGQVKIFNNETFTWENSNETGSRLTVINRYNSSTQSWDFHAWDYTENKYVIIDYDF